MGKKKQSENIVVSITTKIGEQKQQIIQETVNDIFEKNRNRERERKKRIAK